MNVKIKGRKKENFETVHIGLLVDESGSMASIKSDTIETINNFIKEQKSVKGEAKITIASFNDEYKTVVKNCNIQDVNEISEKDYNPDSYTALFDSIVKIINDIKINCESDGSNRAIIAIMTDGEENASVEYRGKSDLIKRMIEEKQGDGWKIVFLGANIDSKDYAKTLGINLDLTKNFDATPVGIRSAGLYATQCVTSYRNQ